MRMTDLRRITVIIIVATALTGCGPSRPPSGVSFTRVAATPTSPAAPRTSLTPSVPGVFRTGVNHCGAPFAVNATTAHGTIALLDCPGMAGLQPTPTVRVRVGDEILVSGLPHTATLTLCPGELLARRGDAFFAAAPGRTVVTVDNVLCLPPPGRRQPRSCPLLAVQIS